MIENQMNMQCILEGGSTSILNNSHSKVNDSSIDDTLDCIRRAYSNSRCCGLSDPALLQIPSEYHNSI